MLDFIIIIMIVLNTVPKRICGDICLNAYCILTPCAEYIMCVAYVQMKCPKKGCSLFKSHIQLEQLLCSFPFFERPPRIISGSF